MTLTIGTFVSKVMSLLFNTLFRFVKLSFKGASVFNFVATVTLCSDFGAQENKVCHCFQQLIPANKPVSGELWLKQVWGTEHFQFISPAPNTHTAGGPCRKWFANLKAS